MSVSGSSAQLLPLGLAGFGRVVQDYYLPVLRNMEHGKIVAIVDPRPEATALAKKLFPAAQIFFDHQSMFDQCKLDGILIATPPSSHFEIWQKAIKRKIPVFVEKPLILSSQIKDFPPNENPKIMIDFNRRFWPAYNRVRSLVQDGTFGAPVQMDFQLHLNLKRWSRFPNHRLDPNEGGVLHDLGCHAIDLAMQFFSAEPLAIEAMKSGESKFQLRLLFKDKSQALCDLAYGNQTRERLSLRGPKATLRLEEPNVALHLQEDNANDNRMISFFQDAALLLYRGFRRSESMGRSTIRSAIQAFVDCIRTGSPFSPGYSEGLRNALWVAAADLSSKSNGQPKQA